MWVFAQTLTRNKMNDLIAMVGAALSKVATAAEMYHAPR